MAWIGYSLKKIGDMIRGGELTQKTYVDNKPSGYKNLLINPKFKVSQRGSSFYDLAPSSETWVADRWNMFVNSVGGLVTTSYINGGLRIACTGATSIGTYNNIIIQKMENSAYNDLRGKTVTFSVSMYTTQDCNVYLRSYSLLSAVSGDVTLISKPIKANTKTKLDFTFTIQDRGESTSDSDWIGIQLYTDNLNETTYYYDTQLEEGTVATPFENRPYGLELSLCQRYYQNSYPKGVAVGSNNGQVKFHPFYIPEANSNIGMGQDLITEMRISPTVTFYSVYGVINEWHGGQVGVNEHTLVMNAPQNVSNTHFARYTAGNTGTLVGDNVLYGHWVADAEL